MDIPQLVRVTATAAGAAATTGLTLWWTAAAPVRRSRAGSAAARRWSVTDRPFPWVGPVAAAVVAALLARPASSPTGLAAIAVLAGVGAVLTVTDLRWQLLPDRVTGPASLLVLVLAGVHATAASSADVLLTGVIQGGVAAGVLLGFFVVVDVVLNRGGAPGLGDVKLAGLLGFALGALGGSQPESPVWWPAQALQLLVLGELTTVLLGLVQRIRSRHWGPVPAGPGFLAAAAVVGALGTLNG